MCCAALLKPRMRRKAGPNEERRALSAHIEEGYQQAERGELIDGDQARNEIQAMKNNCEFEQR